MVDKTAIIEALKEGKTFVAYCAEDDFWRSWQYNNEDQDVMSCRGWGKTGNGADFVHPDIAACEILSCMKSVRFKTN
jgi:hypothetical protein